MARSRRVWLVVGGALAVCLCSGSLGGLVLRAVGEQEAAEAAEQALAAARRSGDVEAERAALRRLAELGFGAEAGERWLALAGVEAEPGARSDALKRALIEDPSLDPAPSLFVGLPNEAEVRTAWLDATVASTGGVWRLPEWDTAEGRGLAVERPTGQRLATLLRPLGGLGAKVAVYEVLARCGGNGACYAPVSLAWWRDGAPASLAWTADDHATVVRALEAAPRGWYWHAALAGDAVATEWLLRDLAEAPKDELVALLRDEGILTIDASHENETTFHPGALARVPTPVVESCAKRLEVGWAQAALDSQMPATIAGKGLAEELGRRRRGN